MPTVKITKENFKEIVLESNSTVLLDFWADWCGPCRMIAPAIEEIADENPEITVGKINVDEEAELAQEFKIISIPSLFVMKDGKVTNQEIQAYGVESDLEKQKKADRNRLVNSISMYHDIDSTENEPSLLDYRYLDAEDS